MPEARFDVFGRRRVAVTECAAGWQAFWLGDDGKRRAADFIVPDFLIEAELAQYLADLFHEDATPEHPAVVRIDGPRSPTP